MTTEQLNKVKKLDKGVIVYEKGVAKAISLMDYIRAIEALETHYKALENKIDELESKILKVNKKANKLIEMESKKWNG